MITFLLNVKILSDPEVFNLFQYTNTPMKAKMAKSNTATIIETTYTQVCKKNQIIHNRSLYLILVDRFKYT